MPLRRGMPTLVKEIVTYALKSVRGIFYALVKERYYFEVMISKALISIFSIFGVGFITIVNFDS